MKKVVHSHEGWSDPPGGTPETVEIVLWEDTEVASMRQNRKEVKNGLGRVFTAGIVVKETKRTLSLCQSLYIPSEKGHIYQVGDVITIPKSIIRKRTILAKAK